MERTTFPCFSQVLANGGWSPLVSSAGYVFMLHKQEEDELNKSHLRIFHCNSLGGILTQQ